MTNKNSSDIKMQVKNRQKKTNQILIGIFNITGLTKYGGDEET